MNLRSYNATRVASYTGYVTQAIANNLAPLLFLTFQRQFHVSLASVTVLVTLNFGVQLLTDLAATKFVDKIGYRATAVIAHMLNFLGLLGMGTLPFLLPNAYAGLLIATVCNAIGGGLIEVIISPIVEALPGEHKAASMALLHSFYCWGSVAVVLLSTLYFAVVGMEHWRFLPMIWALVPLANTLLFTKVPLANLMEEGHEPLSLRRLFTKKTFLLLFLLMLCAGASEQAMSQWASLFAEMGLGVSKTVGDLLGPCLFAVLMGTSRILFGLRKTAKPLENTLLASSLLCVFSYALTVFSPLPVLSLLGCGLTGFSVGVLWPGTFSLAAKHYPQGGTAMFAILALAGDLGCSSGPGLVGLVSSGLQTLSGSALGQFLADNSLKGGILLGVLFPVIMGIGVHHLARRTRRKAAPAAETQPTRNESA